MNKQLKQKLIQFFRKNDCYESRRTLSNNGLSPKETMKLLELLGIEYKKDVSSFNRKQREELQDLDTLIEIYEKKYGGLCFSPPNSPGTIDSNQFTAPRETAIDLGQPDQAKAKRGEIK